MKYTLFILLFGIINAQNFIIKGKIIDSKTGEPLPFASIYAINSKKYVPSNADGTFEITLSSLPDTLKIMYLGYESKKVLISSRKDFLIIKLNPTELKLEEVVITPTKDPVLVFMKRVIKNKKKHNPANYKYYEYDSYNKIIMTVEDTVFLDTLINSYLFLWEIVTHKIHKYPNKDYEEILATRMSGLKKLALPFSPTDLQSLSFYDNKIKISGNEYISPLSVSTFMHYKFTCIDTLIKENNDSLFVIKFTPKNKAENLLEGNMVISSKELALLSIQAEASKSEDNPFIPKFSIKQIYDKVYGKWFTTQLIGEYSYVNFKLETLDSSKYTYPIVKITTHLNNIVISDDTIPKYVKKIKLMGIEVNNKALKRDSSFWNSYRPYELTEKEKNTYINLDTLVEQDPVAEAKLMFALKQFRKIPYGLIQIKFIDINLNKLLSYNKVEGTRIGLGLITNNELSRIFSVGTYFGYGFKDKIFKYGGQFSLTPLNNKSYKILFFAEYDIKEIGNFYIHPKNNFTYFQKIWLSYPLEARSFYVSMMKYYTKYEGGLFFPVIKNMYSYIGISQWYVDNTVYNLPFIRLRWAIKQKLLLLNGETYVHTPGNPVIYLKVLGDTRKHRIDVAITGNKSISPTINFYYCIRGGKINNFSDYFFWHSFEANGDESIIYSENSLQTLPYNTYIVSNYVTSFFAIRKKNTKFPSSNYHPDLVIHFNLGTGGDAYPRFSSLEPVYTEAGITLEHLFPKPFDSIGASAFIPVNKYYFTSDRIEQNIKLKLFVSQFGK